MKKNFNINYEGFKSFVLKFTAFALSLSFIVITMSYTGSVLFNFSKENETSTANLIETKKSVIIDAGHGGSDGGAVSTVNGALEKDLNLSVSLMLSELLQASGIDVIMTRTEDVLLYDENTRGTKKSQDLKNRLLYTVNNPDSIFVSIHMNTFPREQYKGLQVFYSPNNDSSRDLADIVQSTTKAYLQNDNQREIKRANSNIYILWRTEVPAVLVECGFLSNSEEAELLTTDEYRQKLALVLYSSIMNYFNSEEE